MKLPMVESAREVCSSVRERGKNPKNVWWNGVVTDAVEKKEAEWKDALGATDKFAKERSMEAYKEEKGRVKGCIYQIKNEMIGQFGR